jgi:hypothetical protein
MDMRSELTLADMSYSGAAVVTFDDRGQTPPQIIKNSVFVYLIIKNAAHYSPYQNDNRRYRQG